MKRIEGSPQNLTTHPSVSFILRASDGRYEPSHGAHRTLESLFWWTSLTVIRACIRACSRAGSYNAFVRPRGWVFAFPRIPFSKTFRHQFPVQLPLPRSIASVRAGTCKLANRLSGAGAQWDRALMCYLSSKDKVLRFCWATNAMHAWYPRSVPVPFTATLLWSVPTQSFRLSPSVSRLEDWKPVVQTRFLPGSGPINLEAARGVLTAHKFRLLSELDYSS